MTAPSPTPDTHSPNTGDNSAENTGGLLATRRSEVSTGTRAAGRSRDRVLAATQQLLATTAFHELSVADILDASQITRPTFYSYFGSKADVLRALYSSASEHVRHAVRPLYDRSEGLGPAQAITLALTRMAEVWHDHRAVLAATIENRYAIPELRQITADLLAVFVESIAAQLDRDRAAGLAPPGPPSTELVSTLVWSTDQNFYAAERGLNPSLADERSVIEPLAAQWLRTLYGWAPTAHTIIP